MLLVCDRDTMLSYSLCSWAVSDSVEANPTVKDLCSTFAVLFSAIFQMTLTVFLL